MRNRIVKAKHDIIDAIDQALTALDAGELVVYPTETFYALGADAASPRALEHLFAIKRREPDKPVALIVADLAMARQVVVEIPATALRLAQTFWPGPLTMILPARSGLNAALLGNGGGVGLRVSSHPIAHALVQRLGRPLTATSANLAGEPPADSIEQARAAFGNKVAVYLEGGRLGLTPASTVIAFDRSLPHVLRQGPISEGEIAAALRSEVVS
ncbi:MAG TPA: L-threonylcarbamoyladenylate synthase [Candidatus Binataceae bacterium]|nr:L-threonylcarbamoyladenylate synthase [Candidatus Binataceae bacterium]